MKSRGDKGQNECQRWWGNRGGKEVRSGSKGSQRKREKKRRIEVGGGGRWRRRGRGLCSSESCWEKIRQQSSRRD